MILKIYIKYPILYTLTLLVGFIFAGSFTKKQKNKNWFQSLKK